MWRSFPFVRDVRILRGVSSDRGAIPIVMVLEMDFPTLDAIHAFHQIYATGNSFVFNIRAGGAKMLNYAPERRKF
jgi:hypothetical protein